MSPHRTPQKISEMHTICAECFCKTLCWGEETCHVTSILIGLHWLPVEQRILFKVLLLTFKALHGKAPSYLKDLLLPYTPARTLRSASANMLVCPQSHYVETRKRAFSLKAPIEWNQLPVDLKTCETDLWNCFKCFQSKVKNSFIQISILELISSQWLMW